jgi:hypothetical protein
MFSLTTIALTLATLSSAAVMAKPTVTSLQRQIDELAEIQNELSVKLAEQALQNKIKAESSALGDIKVSLLDRNNFIALNGQCWELMNGASISRSALKAYYNSSNLPDARGRFLRMFNNGTNVNPDNNKIGQLQEDEFKAHDHKYTGFATGPLSIEVGHFYGNMYADPISKPTSTTGGKETRAKNVTVNYFVKIHTSASIKKPCL